MNSNTPEYKCKVKYPDLSDAVKLCLAAGRYCKMAKSDMRSAFRQLGIKPKHWAWLVMAASSPLDKNWYFFVDKCLPFGSSISCAHFQEFSNAIVWIVRYRTGQNLVNYLDDYFFVALLTMMCNGQVDTFLQVCKEVNFPVSLEKTFWGTTKLVFLGMLLDSENQVIGLPVDKIEKGLELVNLILSKRFGKVTVHSTQKLCGFLNFLCRSIVPGRAFTQKAVLCNQ